MKIKVKKDDARLNPGDEFHHSGLEKRQKVLSVVFLVRVTAYCACYMTTVRNAGLLWFNNKTLLALR